MPKAWRTTPGQAQRSQPPERPATCRALVVRRVAPHSCCAPPSRSHPLRDLSLRRGWHDDEASTRADEIQGEIDVLSNARMLMEQSALCGAGVPSFPPTESSTVEAPVDARCRVHVHECSSVGARITPPLPLRPGGDSLGDDAHGDGDGNWGVNRGQAHSTSGSKSVVHWHESIRSPACTTSTEGSGRHA
jgi:hypothetical protein